MNNTHSIKKNIAILGSTGSIGKQALEVIDANPNYFTLKVLTAQSNAELLAEQTLRYRPATIVIVDESKLDYLKNRLIHTPVNILSGESALSEIMKQDDFDFVVVAIVGFAALKPVIKAIENKKNIGLANKETLVVAGEIIVNLAKKNKVKIIPIDSEHSAIFQCLCGEENNPIEKIILTASGGPFRGKQFDYLQQVTIKEALNHPNWSMGIKITLDSATLMNKGLEVIEAKWLFDLDISQIDVAIHPQSVIHSMVQFQDGSVKAQLGVPDMKIPIQYALSYPKRIISEFKRFDFRNYPSLNFETPDKKNFPCLELAYKALNLGGNSPCILNAANEIAVQRFINNEIRFTDIPVIINYCLDNLPYISHPVLDDYYKTDYETRLFAKRVLTSNF